MNFVYCPAPIRAALVAAGVDLRKLVDLDRLANILSPEDVAFYVHVNLDTKDLLPAVIPQSLPNAVVGEMTRVVSAESLAVSNEGIVGAAAGYLLGSAAWSGGAMVGFMAGGPVGGIIGSRVGMGTVNAGIRAKREDLKRRIEAISERLVQLRRGDIAEAKREGIKIRDKDLEPISKINVMESALLGMVIPFYTTYQGHQVEELQAELRHKMRELKDTFRANNIATESIAGNEPASPMREVERLLTEYSLNGNAPPILTTGQKVICDLMDENTILFSHAPLEAGEASDKTPAGLSRLLDRLIQQLVVFHPFEVVAGMPIFGAYLRASQAMAA